MRLILALVALALLAGCTSNEYSKAPEPTGEWAPANPASLTAEAPPAGRRAFRLNAAAVR